MVSPHSCLYCCHRRVHSPEIKAGCRVTSVAPPQALSFTGEGVPLPALGLLGENPRFSVPQAFPGEVRSYLGRQQTVEPFCADIGA